MHQKSKDPVPYILPNRQRSKSLSDIDIHRNPTFSFSNQASSNLHQETSSHSCGSMSPSAHHPDPQYEDDTSEIMIQSLAETPHDDAENYTHVQEQVYDPPGHDPIVHQQSGSSISQEVHVPQTKVDDTPEMLDNENIKDDNTSIEPCTEPLVREQFPTAPEEARIKNILTSLEQDPAEDTSTSPHSELDSNSASDYDPKTPTWLHQTVPPELEPWPSHTPQEPPNPSSPPLPTPNTLTKAFLPFTSHLALTNHLSMARISSYATTSTPIFLHGPLQLPSSLSTLLSLPVWQVVKDLTPAVLLQHTTTVDPSTLLPSLVPATVTSTYTHVQGLLFFPARDVSTILQEWWQGQEESGPQMRKVRVQIVDAEGERYEVDARAWVAEEKGVEEWWTMEEFVAGRIAGLGGVRW